MIHNQSVNNKSKCCDIQNMSILVWKDNIPALMSTPRKKTSSRIKRPTKSLLGSTSLKNKKLSLSRPSKQKISPMRPGAKRKQVSLTTGLSPVKSSLSEVMKKKNNKKKDGDGDNSQPGTVWATFD